jgi:SAM-dependent methyltransferase
MSSSISAQANHYDKITESYTKHYGDKFSVAYRDIFMFRPMYQGISLANKQVLDAMCGGGECTEILIQAGAYVTGLDVSPKALDNFQVRHPNTKTVCASITQTGLPDNSFDVVNVFGGLHHLHPHLNEAIREIHRILKPGGYLAFTEPHAHSIPDKLRQMWYSLDPLFVENEAAIDMAALKKEHAPLFEYEVETYAGSIAYLLVLNSMVFRMPWVVKKLISPTLLWLERITWPILTPNVACFVNARWRKK